MAQRIRKKILLLGGGHGQLPAIHEANRRGYYTILCDYLTDNPCRKFADEYYNVSTTDKDAVLKLARQKEIDLIFTYASDPATPTAAYVAEKLNLPGSPYDSVKLLSNKDLFRKFLNRHRFNVPEFTIVDSDSDLSDVDDTMFPAVAKPVDSSDTKGVAIVKSRQELKKSVENALVYSRKGKVIIEKYIEIGEADLHGDAFFVDGEMVFCMLGDRIFSSESNSLKPSTELYPTRKNRDLVDRVEKTVAKVVKLSGFTFGAVNIEVRVDPVGNLYVLEIGPRSGGTLTPETIAYSTGFNMLNATFDFFEDCKVHVSQKEVTPSICFALHSNKAGILDKIEFGGHLQPYIAEKHIYKKTGDLIKPYSEAGSTIGVLIFSFTDMAEAEKIAGNLYDDVLSGIYLKPVTEEQYRKQEIAELQ